MCSYNKNNKFYLKKILKKYTGIIKIMIIKNKNTTTKNTRTLILFLNNTN